MAILNSRLRRLGKNTSSVGRMVRLRPDDGNRNTPEGTSGSKFVARLKAVRAAWVLSPYLTSAWFLVLPFWFLSIVTYFFTNYEVFGISIAKVVDFVAWLFGKQTNFGLTVPMFFIIVAWIIHVFTLVVAFAGLWFMRAHCTSTSMIFAFALILFIGSSFPFLQVIPWFAVYLVAIVLLQTGEKKGL